MKFKKMYSENTYSFGKIELDFTDYAGATTIILGKNIDQKSSNGAGKTSLIKTLYWGLWNKDLNGANLESVTRRGTQSGALVDIEFEDRGNEYKIIRYKDYVSKIDSPKLSDGTIISGTGVEFIVNGQAFNGESHSQTQKIIEQKIRMSPRLFLSAVLMAQRSGTHFLTANDTDKKDILSEMLDLKIYDDAFKKIKEAITELEGKINNSELKIDSLNDQIEGSKENIKKLEEDELKYNDEKSIKLQQLDFDISQIRKQVDELKIIAIEKDISIELKKELEATEQKIKKIKKELEVEGEANKVLIKLENDKTNITNKKDRLIIENNEKQLQINELVNNSNKEINFNYENWNNLKLKLENISEKGNLLKNTISQEPRILKQLDSLNKNINNTIKNISDINHKIDETVKGNFCHTCKREFLVGQNDSLEAILIELNNQLKILENLKSDEESQLILLQNELIDVEQSKKDLAINQTLFKQTQELLETLNNEKQEVELLKQKKEINQNQINLLNQNISRNIEEINKDVILGETIDLKIVDIKKLINDLIPQKEELFNLEESISEKRLKISESEVLSSKIQQAKVLYKEKVEQGNKLIAEKKELVLKINPYTAMLQRVSEQVKNYEVQLNKLKDIINENQEELKYLIFWKNGFSPSGIRSFITDDVIDLLNKKTQENLNDLFDGAITVVFDPESKNNKGISSNKISTTFLLNGKETPFESLSGGEKQRAILATELALTEVAEARAGTKLNIRFLDEPFDGIDDNGQIKSLVLFSRLARDKDGFFVISHEEKFQTLCQKAVYVIKHREVSRVVDKHTFDNINIASDSTIDEFNLEDELLNVNKPMKKNVLDGISKKRKQKNEEDDF